MEVVCPGLGGGFEPGFVAAKLVVLCAATWKSSLTVTVTLYEPAAVGVQLNVAELALTQVEARTQVAHALRERANAIAKVARDARHTKTDDENRQHYREHCREPAPRDMRPSGRQVRLGRLVLQSLRGTGRAAGLRDVLPVRRLRALPAAARGHGR